LRARLEHPEDDSLAILRDMPRGDGPVCVFWAGLGDGRRPARFPFLASSEPYDLDRVFVRDVDELWYQRGAGTGSIDDLANELASTLRDRVGQVTMFGNSSGGYAALLFGSLLGVKAVHVWLPQTFLAYRLRLRHGDYRWPEHLARMIRLRALDHRYADLRGVLERRRSPTTFNIYYATRDRLDSVHAERLAGVEGVALHPYETGGHTEIRHGRRGLGQIVRDSGELDEIFRRVSA
jgi:hypothetical protein